MAVVVVVQKGVEADSLLAVPVEGVVEAMVAARVVELVVVRVVVEKAVALVVGLEVVGRAEGTVGAMGAHCTAPRSQYSQCHEYIRHIRLLNRHHRTSRPMHTYNYCYTRQVAAMGVAVVMA